MGDVVTKECRRCSVVKNSDSFYKVKPTVSKDCLHSYCKECVKLSLKEDREKVKEKNILNGCSPTVSSKRCVNCNSVKSSSEFYSDITRKDCLSNKCITCNNKKSADYYEKNSDDIKNRVSKYYLDNTEIAKARVREYYSSNTEECLDRNKRWSKNNPDKMHEYKVKRRALVRNALVDGEPVPTREYLLARDGEYCFYCGVTLCRVWSGSKKIPLNYWTIDHCTSLETGGKHTRCNTVLACFRCNARKQERSLEEFLGLEVENV